MNDRLSQIRARTDTEYGASADDVRWLVNEAVAELERERDALRQSLAGILARIHEGLPGWIPEAGDVVNVTLTAAEVDAVKALVEGTP